ncbi:cold shock domain-containing protein [Vibrio owensii]|uniref:cold shock domain-containing protein n=1 Tax=Vibrio owensii TaxID=696485 RepID=UPI004068DFDC
MLGIVKWFNDKKGFGFINEFNTATEQIANDLDLFVHFNEIEGNGYKSLNDGELVNFELVHTNKGPQCRKVTRVAK